MGHIHGPNPPGSGIRKDDDEEVIELTRVVSASPKAVSGKPLPGPDSGKAEAPDLARLAAEITGDAEEATVSPGKTVAVPLDQLEQVLEKVVARLYSGAIEAKVMEIMEKHVRLEIDKITALIADAAEKGK